MGGEVLVRFSMVEKTYDGVSLVIKNIDLDIRRGEFVTLLGPSGSGKTTTLMMLAGFETPTSGEITLNGRSINTLPPHKRDIGMVFQNYALFPHMTVERNVAFPLQVRKIPAGETTERVQEALEMVRLSDFGKRRPAQLSGGQQQRVALARALVFGPELVLMDEPLGALDKQLREHMQIEIKHLQKKLGITVVYVTHDQSEALTMSDRVAVFNDGVIQQIASPDILYEQPRNSFVANFVGENNNLSGVIESVDGERCLVALANGARVGAKRVNVRGLGMPTSISLRPERLFFGDGPTDGVNRLEATVTETLYLGDHLRVIMDVAGHTGIMARSPRSSDLPAPKPGDRLPIWFRPDDCRSLNPIDTPAEVERHGFDFQN